MRNLLFIYAGLLFFSCNDIKFKEAQPQDFPTINAFPDELIGSYYESESKDTLVVKKKSFVFGNTSSLFFVQGTLSDTTKLKKMDNTYFVNLYENKVWSLVMVKLLQNKNLSISVFNAEDEVFIANVKAIIPLEEVYNDNKTIEYYIAQPSAKQLKQIINIQPLTESKELKRISK